MRDGTDITICAVILNKKAPKHLVLVVTRTPDFPAFFPPAGICLSYESDRSPALHWVLDSRHAHDLAPALTGLMGAMLRFGGKGKPSLLSEFLTAPLGTLPS